METNRWNFSLRDIFAGCVGVGICLAIAAPIIRTQRDRSRYNQCVSNLRQAGLGIHKSVDVFRRLPPLTTTRLQGVTPGSAEAGYGWSIWILPYINRTRLYNDIVAASDRRRLPAFSLAPRKGSQRPVWAEEIELFLCPSVSIPRFATAPEFSRYSGVDSSGNRFGVATSNFVTLTATHLACVDSSGVNRDATKSLNGIITTGRRTWADIVDGSSKTFMLCESCEAGYSSWYDGTVGWVVAADPNGPEPAKDVNDYWVTTGNSSLQVGTTRVTVNAAYLPASKLSTIQVDRKWGPSSEHASGVVNHLTGDGAVHAIAVDIDPTLYLQLTTRAGREPVSVP